MKLKSILRTIIGIPVAMWVTVKVQFSWETLVTTVSSLSYVVSRLLIFIIPGFVLAAVHRIVAIITRSR